MKIKIYEALDLDRKIMNIKVLREATGLALRESKDIVDGLFKSPSHFGVEVYVKDSFNDDDWDAFGEWFVYQTSEGAKSKGKLKLYQVIFRENNDTFISVVLSTSKTMAKNAAADEAEFAHGITLGGRTVTTCEEVTSFKNGQVLLMSRLPGGLN